VVCQNESIDDSEADIASDLRRIVRGQIAAGRSDEQVRAFLVQRYGEFILLKPPLTPGNAVLWLAPAALILIGGAYLWGQSHRSPAAAEPALTAQEELALGALSAGLPDTDPPYGGPKTDPVVPHLPGAKPGH
jgi:cytochrome c-type biogenesis protein CcmH